MKKKFTTKSLVLLLLISTSFTSCTEELADTLAETQEQEGERGEEFDDDFDDYDDEFSDDDFDYYYADAMEENFPDYYMEEGDDCYHMRDDDFETRHRLPPRRPSGHGQGWNQNQYGMAVDGSRIQRGNNGWQFQTSPTQLVNQRGNGRMIGVDRNGVPIYGQVISNHDQEPELDANGGRYGVTDDFPDGVYHYVITINLNRN